MKKNNESAVVNAFVKALPKPLKNAVKKRTDQKDKQSRTDYDIPVLRFCNPAQYINKYSSNTAANTLNQT